eukprot:CAMPEP_0195646300 /NCGR_PEP_ID=MMETSP0815-20121206/29451_1 /TAXON_ID=97485 /ORGANISM="Prymnesium parvum, Strain Texoma1" /LENGTH=55 /DNA_ID=CAMNT_0040789711 /DNA_START=93 /DNA_END=257 /DNA_ORIENTATION=+
MCEPLPIVASELSNANNANGSPALRRICVTDSPDAASSRYWSHSKGRQDNSAWPS